MKAERWREIEDLLDAALERAPAERGLLLERASAGDADLRREVESLLAHQTSSGNFIEGLRCKDYFYARKDIGNIPLCRELKEVQDKLRLPLGITS